MNKKDCLKGTEIAFKDESCMSGSSPYNPRERIVKWRWEFGDGEVSEEQNPTHFYKEPGIYPVKLTVEDGYEQKNSSINSINISMWDGGLILREMCRGKREAQYEMMEKVLDRFLDEIGGGERMLEWKWEQLDESEKQYYTEKYPDIIASMVALKLRSSD